MVKYAISDTTLTAIANAIRDKNGATRLYTPVEMANAINNIGKYIIIAKYPEGSTCSCRKKKESSGNISGGINDYITLVAEDTSGLAVFILPEAGYWNVYCNNGLYDSDEYRTADTFVTIDETIQNEIITLSYKTYLFQSGVGLAEGYSLDKTTYFKEVTTDYINVCKTSSSNFGNANFLPKIDTSKYNTLCADMQTTGSNTSGNTRTLFGLIDYDHNNTSVPRFICSKSTTNTERSIMSIDIKDIVDELYVCVSGNNATGKIYNLWLE